MSRENVEVVRAFFEAWNSGDMDAVRKTYDPDVIVRAGEGWPEPGPWVGRDAVMRQWKPQRGAWDANPVKVISDYIDASSGRSGSGPNGRCALQTPR